MIADSAARARALDVEQSFIVQAPAGSGKTELLIQRFLRLLETVDAPGSVVAITFTKKAAGEMRARVLGALRAAAAGAEPDSDHQRETYRIALRVLERDRSLKWDLIRNPARLEIQTIDALCASITRRMPWLARFGSMPDITENAKDLYREAARNTLRQVDRGDQALSYLLLHLDNDFNVAEKLLVDMLERREQWLHLTSSRPDFDRVRMALESTLSRIILKHLSHVAKSLDSETAAELAAIRGWERFPQARVEDLDLWLEIPDALLTDQHQLRKTVNATLGFPPHHPLKARYLQLLARLQQDDALVEAVRQLRALPSPRFTESQWQALQAAVSVLVLAAAELQQVFREHRRVDFAELSIRASEALGPVDAPTDLGLTLGYEIRHLLVDEFQDTSFMQFELIRQLTAGWEPGDGRTLFLVGDPMQSIYRFRRADVSLFLQAREQGIGAIRLEPLTLTVNFRSPEGIVSWVNRTFASILPPADDIESSAVAYTACEPGIEGAAEVQVHAFDDARDEARSVCNLARQAPGNTAILVRARSHLLLIVEELKRAHIPFQAVEIDALSDKPVAEDLLALTRALLHPADRVSWLAVLRAPWCGLTLEDLQALAGADHRATIWDLMHRPGLALSEEGASRMVRVEPILAASLERRGRLPLRDWVELTWLQLGGPACAHRTELADAEEYLDLLDEIAEGGDLADFTWLRAQVDDRYAQIDARAGDGLQLMTIHKAKGLEFDTVILPSLNEPARVDDSSLLVWLEQQGDLLLAVKPETRQGEDRIYSYIEAVERNKSRHENERLLYVAVTRAKRAVHLVASLPRKEDGSSAQPQSRSFLKLLWDTIGADFQTAPRTSSESPLAPARQLRRFVSGWQAPQPPQAVRIERPHRGAARPIETIAVRANETARYIGTALHGFLQRIAEEGLSVWTEDRILAGRERYRAVLANLGVPGDQQHGAAARVEAGLLKVIRDRQGRWILESHVNAQCEASVAGMVDGQLVEIVADRTFVDDEGVRWIIDYKTSEPHGGDLESFLDDEQARYRDQLERYARLLAQLDSRIIRLGLYFPFTAGWREWGAATIERRQATQSMLFEL